MSRVTLITLDNIQKEYENSGVILDNLSLEIKKGEFLAIVGKSGSGKSSLLNIIGLLDTHFQGQYVLNGQKIETLSKSQREKLRIETFGYIFQQYHLVSEYTVMENVELPLAYQNEKKASRRKKVVALLNDLGLADKLHQYPFQLSGGEQQRVAIARAIISQPSIILADEPTGSLDEKTGDMIMSVLETLHKSGATICLVTHDKDIAQRADRVVEVKNKKVVV
ncbi:MULTISPECIES: ABC transporter ATP-binding protein [unclassified Granulicatella]|uniref:ABC transporter ATP-binding protein n=1 Tax=unclassified Granulicatella TaxID=2630493 RepID=UPI001072FD5F|nr:MULTISPECIES: ABC transporter ATP-binding protein [unclassified Granulicatella]MBF0780958.1 ABC transporter ATP-binding protein [Granulicatella sp. 19428wC4_WM01]TFU92978.1 ABC transporter ATP-binding protein [Granulicatella sp. WM01]